MMTTLAEIENAVATLSREQKFELFYYLVLQLEKPAAKASTSNNHSVLDIAPVHIGPVLRPLTDDDDLLGEMLKDRA